MASYIFSPPHLLLLLACLLPASLAHPKTNPKPNLPPPERLKVELQPRYRLLLSGAAANPYPKVLPAMMLPITGIFENWTRSVQEDLQQGIRHIFQTENEWTFFLHGTGLTAMSTVLDNLLEVGDKIVIAVCGYWGDVVVDMARRYGADVIKVEKPWGQAFTQDEFEAAVEANKPKVLFVISGESSTGVFQQFDKVGEICLKHNCISVVDVVGTVGVVPVRMDEWKIDVMYANTQKGFGGVVGLGPVSWSQRAVEVVKARKTLPRMRNHDILLQTKYSWFKSADDIRFFLHSLSLPLFWGIREGLAWVANEGLASVWERHFDTHHYFNERAVKELGLEFYVANEMERLIGTTTFKIPPGKDLVKIEQYTADKYDVLISGGCGSTYGHFIRTGLFGYNARRDAADKLFGALREALECTCTNLNSTDPLR